MDFPVTTIATRIIAAILAVPGSLKNLRDLLPQGKKERALALKELDLIEKHLASFADIGKWLEEAKRFHELAETLDNVLESINTECYRASPEGRFDGPRFRIDVVRETWNRVGADYLEKLLAFATAIKYIEPLPLDRQNSKGPKWAIELLGSQNEIALSFDELDRHGNSHDNIYRIYDRLNALVSRVRSTMTQADMCIRQTAQQLSETLMKMAAEVRSE